MTPREQLEICARFIGWEILTVRPACGTGITCMVDGYVRVFDPEDSDADCALLMDEAARRGLRVVLSYFRIEETWHCFIAPCDYEAAITDHANDIGAARRAAVVGCVCKIVGGE